MGGVGAWALAWAPQPGGWNIAHYSVSTTSQDEGARGPKSSRGGWASTQEPGEPGATGPIHGHCHHMLRPPWHLQAPNGARGSAEGKYANLASVMAFSSAHSISLGHRT